MQQIPDRYLSDTSRHEKTVDKLASKDYCRLENKTALQHTLGHANCPACVRMDAMLTIESATFSALTLAEAVPLWKQIREQRERLRPRTHESTAGYFAALEKFFGDVRLKDITPGQLREYQIARGKNLLSTDRGEIAPWKKPAGNSLINHELAALGKLLNHCGRWRKLKLYYAPLSIPTWSPRDVLNEEDEERLFEKVKGHAEAELAYCVAVITNNTSAAGCELRGLQLKHLTFCEPTIDKQTGIDQTPSTVYIPPEIVKNRNRPRKIPMNPLAKWAFEQCYKRALACGSCGPEDYLFPFWLYRNKWDPKRPASRWFLRKSWGHLVRLANVPGLHPHDLRHQFITRGLENGVDPDSLRAVCGHINPKLTDYYSHIRIQAKLAVVMAVMPKKKPAAPARRDGTHG
jgi:integrase